MTTKRIFCLTAAAVLWAGLTTLSLAIPSPQQPDENVAQSASPTSAGDQGASLPRLQETAAATANPFTNPFAAFGPTTASAEPVAAAPVAYPRAPRPPASSSSWAPTHFEIWGDVQWRNISSNSGLSTSYCLPSGCVTNTGSFSNNLGLSGFGVGPHFGFIWTPEKKIMGATSKIWVEWQQLNRSKTRTISGEFDFLGVTYVIDTTLQTQVNTRQFQLGYAPRWGNDKFRIGPEIEYQRLTVDVTLANLTPGAPPPVTQSVNVPNNIVLLGLDFDYTPVQQFDVFGKSGWIPCCGGGWHENETQLGVKYYIRRNFSLLGGFRYYYLKRDFNAPAQTVTTEEGSITVGPFSGFIKFPGIGPFVGASVRF